jgi:hypothetical protein
MRHILALCHLEHRGFHVTFQTAAAFVDGNTESGNFLRLMLQSSTAGSQGIVGAQDLLVTANTVNNSGINIASGACVVYGAETAFQGSYYGYNVGLDTSLTIAATSGTIRSDMIVIRAEDPTWSGSPWGNPASGQILFPRVLSNVAAGLTTVPGGYSAIPLCRIDMPVSTSAVSQAYIHDLRAVAQPQRIMQVVTAAGPGSVTNWTAGTTPVAWPPGATWQVAIPAWATTMVCSWVIGEASYISGWARGNVGPVFGASVTAPALTFTQPLVSATAGPEHTIAGGFTAAIPASLRGTTQTMQFSQVANGQTGLMAATEATSTSVTYEFQQLASSS